ncbi:uncharacterized protein LOC128548695 [Mercenaria mercenaria]|uniref:uncharacterized protein LOC128548695 n=1 Tax=Mercenaria mercenaria TaxID=6596 RepID=UPI00234EA93F|nr:uncharacterized protein LOC128548695 [Mercenaria mercenaria]
MKFRIIAIICFTCGVYASSSGESCDIPLTLTHVRFPERNELLSLQYFENNVIGTGLGQVYLALPVDPPFIPDSNFQCTITKLGENLYWRSCTGGQAPQCFQLNISLSTEPGTDSAMFTYVSGSGSNITEAYWSRCPTKFIWRIRCTNYAGNTECPPSNTWLSFFLRDSITPSTVPLNDIAEDLWITTGVKFGLVDGLEWYFIGLEDEPCQV